MHRSTSKRQDWGTPPWLFGAAQQLTRRDGRGEFLVDAAAEAHNSLCGTYLADGLANPWRRDTWCNPPFNGTINWIGKAIQEAEALNASVMLVTASTETRWFELAARSGWCHRIIFITGRVSFLDPETGRPVGGNTTGSALLFFRTWRVEACEVSWWTRDELKALTPGGA